MITICGPLSSINGDDSSGDAVSDVVLGCKSPEQCQSRMRFWRKS